MTTRVLFVCLGNICRSPTAEGVFTRIAAGQDIEVDSAGTASWHIGNPPDSRAIAEAARKGYDLSPLRARQVNQNDFNVFDYIIAMDNSNLSNLERLAPKQPRARLALLLDYAPDLPVREVPDPYFEDNFPEVLDMIEQASHGLLREILSE